ncbi:helicase-related protein [Roseateles violae]|uniref:Helicase-related protein n=1 Tax=Roseateles violae TaxID=3058042 RepID=A0ABT8DLA0_9BURK|nr:helicase-related protein [Pelomonas sp. PFR6]MDN3919190.1 helicase-related protein [Pelomonas sp. PFR6]
MPESNISNPDTPAAIALPNPRHAARLPAELSPEQWQRIRQAAYQLPQVLSPADLDDEASEGAALLERAGLVLIQKAVSGARPSRWIAPRLIAVALRHLDAVGSAPTVRALMQQRNAALDGLGLSREGLVWTRLCKQVLRLSKTIAWQPTVSYRVELADDSAIWDFYRDGDLAALKAALGQRPPYAEAEALHAHLEALLARSESGHPEHLDSLLPRLQAECATPQDLDALKAACTRAQDRWEHQVAELHALAGLTADLAFRGYPDSFETARRMQRTVTLYVGAPNSGKTHAAFERLAQAHDGAYLAPLRLLALEGRDRLVARGVPCSLLTGEENVPAEQARVVSSTIEMVNTGKAIDVAVIDEAQMLFDASRGWAWTQAIVGTPANELIIICSAYAVPAIENLLGLCGERCTVRHFERKQQVQLLSAPVPIAALQRGDAVVAFSRREVLMLRDQIASAENGGHPVSVIYGALPPEVRRREAERFANGKSHILVATDAIGMGLNLPIRRVLFSTMTKFDGQGDRPLDVSETHQIAGRAGRYGMHDEGFCGVLREAEPGAARALKETLPKQPRAPRGFKAAVAPNWWHVETIAQRLGLRRLRAVLDVFVDQLRLDDAHFAVAELDQMLELAEALDHSCGQLPLKTRFIYAQAPVDSRTPSAQQEFLDWTQRHALTGRAGEPWFLQDVDEHSRLDRMEQALRSCTLWLWLDLRFPGIYGHVDEVVDLRSRLNDGIERHLKGKKPLWRSSARGGRR